MKSISLILTTILLTTNLAFGKKNAVQLMETHYAVNLSQINSGSGHGMGYTFNGNIMKGRKALEVGLIFSERESKISGADFKYRIFLGNVYRIDENQNIFSPYLQYNLIYQKGISYSPDIIELGSESYTIPSEPGIVSTLGHYVSGGNKLRLFSRAYLDTSFGLGLYQGSLDKIDGPGTWGIHKENYGFTFAFKVGLGYTFN